MNQKKTDLKKIQKSEPGVYTRGAIEENERKKLQEFYSSVLGGSPEEVETNSRILRNKIYRFGLVVILVACVFYFFVVGKISFVTG